MPEPDNTDDSKASDREIERGVLLHVGSQVYPVFGNDALGWTLDSGDLDSRVSDHFRYQTLAEVFFVIVNFSIATQGSA